MRAQAAANREEGEVIDDVLEPPPSSQSSSSGRPERASYDRYDRYYDRYRDYHRHHDDYRYRDSRYYEHERGRSPYPSSRYPPPPLPRYRDYETTRSRHSYRDYRYDSRSRTPPRRDSRGYYDDHHRRFPRSRDETDYLHDYERDRDSYYRLRDNYRPVGRSSSSSRRLDDIDRSQRHSSVSSTSSTKHSQIADMELKKKPDQIDQPSSTTTDRDVHSSAHAVAKEESGTRNLDISSFRQSQNQPASLAERAKKRTFDELSAVVVKDLKSRVIGPSLHDHKLRYDVSSTDKAETKTNLPISSSSEDSTRRSNGHPGTNHPLDHESRSLSHLPRIKKKHSTLSNTQEERAPSNQHGSRVYGDERTNIPVATTSRTPSIFRDAEEKPAASLSISKQRPRRLRDYLEQQENQVDLVNVELLQQLNRKQSLQKEQVETQAESSTEDHESDASEPSVNLPRKSLKRNIILHDSESSEEEGEITRPSPGPRRYKRRRAIQETDSGQEEEDEEEEADEVEEETSTVIPPQARQRQSVNMPVDTESPMDVTSPAQSAKDDMEEDRIEVEDNQPQIDEQEEHAKYEQALLASDESDDDLLEDESSDLVDTPIADDEPPELDPFRQVQDVEDYQFLRLAVLEKIHKDGINGKFNRRNGT